MTSISHKLTDSINATNVTKIQIGLLVEDNQQLETREKKWKKNHHNNWNIVETRKPQMFFLLFIIGKAFHPFFSSSNAQWNGYHDDRKTYK